MIQVHKPRIWLMLFVAMAAVLGVKSMKASFVLPGPPLVTGSQPLLLFFNNEEGCECVLPLYARADEIIADWPSDRHGEIEIKRFVLDERPDLQRQYGVERAPMLLLLDAGGQVMWREWGVASNPNVFDLAAVEEQINLLVAAPANESGD
jgi:hypothetical protein